jgi:prepilin-type N-terminal cleavage/methylation domain-containing protein
MRKQKGFSLIELLIVVAVILILAGIAIPTFVRSRINANEASAVTSLRYINTAEVTFASTYPNVGFAPDLATLGPGLTAGASPSSTNAILLDGVLGASSPGGASLGTPNQKSGYNFYLGNITGNPVSTYSANGDPIIYQQTGRRYFYNDASGVIRYNSTQTATSTDSSIQ